MTFTRIGTVDRSVLAQNIYQLLFKSEGISLVPFYAAQDLAPTRIRKLGLKLLLVSSNALNQQSEEPGKLFKENRALLEVPKLFLCRDSERSLRNHLSRLPNAKILSRPFHPDEAINLVQQILKQNETPV